MKTRKCLIASITYWEAALIVSNLAVLVVCAVLYLAWWTTTNSLRAYQAQEAAQIQWNQHSGHKGAHE